MRAGKQSIGPTRIKQVEQRQARLDAEAAKFPTKPPLKELKLQDFFKKVKSGK